MPISPKSKVQEPPVKTASEIMQEQVATIRRLIGLDINRLAIGSDIEGIVGSSGIAGQIWPADYTITGVNVIEFVNVSSNIVIGTQTGT